MNTEEFWLLFSRRLNATTYLRDLSKPTIERWTTALGTLREKSQNESLQKWRERLDTKALSEMNAYVLSKEEEIRDLIPKDVPPNTHWDIPSAGTVVLSGLVELQVLNFGKSSLDSQNYSLLRKFPSLLVNEKKRNDFSTLKKYLEEMSMEANYQPVMIKLLLMLGRAFRSEIAAYLREYNPQNQTFDYRRAEVFRTLRENNIAVNEGSLFMLKTEELSMSEQRELIQLCNEQIRKYNTIHEVPSRKYIKFSKDDYAPVIATFLQENFGIECDHIKQNLLRMPSGAILHTKISSSKSNWYGLDKKIFDEFLSLTDNVFLVLSMDGPENSFIIPKGGLLDILDESALKKRPRRTMLRWMIRIKNPDNRYMITVDHSPKRHYVMPYLNAWQQVIDIKESFARGSVKEHKDRTAQKVLTMNDIESKSHNGTPKRKVAPISRIVRDTVKSLKMKLFYEYRCQVCNHRIESGSTYYAEVHHLWPLGEGGADNGDNMLVLCPNHHVEFDYGIIGIDSTDGRSVVDYKKNIVGKVSFREGHKLKDENIHYQLGRMISPDG